MKKAQVLENHAPVHDEVLAARAGDKLRPERADDEWPGWIWCVAESGVGSWVPDAYLAVEGAEARLLRDYEATELTIKAGDLLALQYEVNGWWWAVDEEGHAGWVPEKKLAVIQKL